MCWHNISTHPNFPLGNFAFGPYPHRILCKFAGNIQHGSKPAATTTVAKECGVDDSDGHGAEEKLGGRQKKLGVVGQ